MPDISVMRTPAKALPVLSWLARLSESEADTLRELLQSTQLQSPRAMTEQFRALAADSDAGAARDLTEVLFNLLSLHHSHGWPIEEIAAAAASDDRLSLIDEQRKALRERLASAMAAPTVALLAKAYDIGYEHQNILHTSRILTDIRPVFDENVENGPKAVVITNTLKLDYFSRGGHREIYVAVNREDLTELRRSVERAMAKIDAVEKTLRDSGLASLDITS